MGALRASKNHTSSVATYSANVPLGLPVVGEQPMMPELERMVGITWSISLALQVRRLRPREGKQLAQVPPPVLGSDGFGTRISGLSFQAHNVVKLWESPRCRLYRQHIHHRSTWQPDDRALTLRKGLLPRPKRSGPLSAPSHLHSERTPPAREREPSPVEPVPEVPCSTGESLPVLLSVFIL